MFFSQRYSVGGWRAMGSVGVWQDKERTRDSHSIHSHGRAGWSEPLGGGCAWSLPGVAQGEAGFSLNYEGLQ